jgi:hypothetical protein
MVKLICSTISTLAAITAIIILELKALSLGIDGILFSGVIIIIAGLGGYNANQIKKVFKK